MNAVVIGAGPAGLAAAQALVDGGARVTVIETDAQVGGLAKSHQLGDHLADFGPHRLHQEASAEVRRFLGSAGGLAFRLRGGRIEINGCSVDYPLSPTATLLALGLRQSLKFATGAALARLRRSDGTYAGEATRRMGRPLYEALYAPAARKIWGRAPTTLHADQARARVGVGGALALLGRLVGRGEPGRYLYPGAGANGLAYTAWAADLESSGASILLGTRVETVQHEHGLVSAVRALRGEAAFSCPADRIISTLPLPMLLGSLSPPVPTNELGILRFRTVVILYCIVARSRLTDRDVHYFPDESVPFARMTEQTAFGRVDAAPANETVLTLDFYDEPGGRFTVASSETLLDIAWPTLARFGLRQQELRRHHKVVADNAYPVLSVEYRAARDQCLDRVASIEGLLTTGRAGLFLHVNQHHAIEMGLAAGRTALGGENVARTWRNTARRFETCRVVD